MIPLASWCQEVGDTVLLESTNPAGVPVHPADGDNSFVRWPNDSVATLVQIGNWRLVQASDGDSGWVTDRYITVMSQVTPEPETEEEGEEDFAYVFGTWNIEHFKAGKERGFPENLSGGPNYPQHQRDLTLVAAIIRDELQAAVLVLNEINGIAGSSPPRSNELNSLITELGSGWDYVLSSDGGSQRTAILFDSSKAQGGNCHEFPNNEGPRDHLGCLFTLWAPNGSPMNDVIVIGIHLKSGQHENALHDVEMEGLEQEFSAAFDGDPLPSAERDIVIAGDFNANYYDSDLETFWQDFAGADFDIEVLAPANAADYPPTRLAKVPLRPNSVIDYVMASSARGGVRQDLVRSTAHVHDELLTSPFEDFRRVASDHIPVTIRIKIVADDD